MAIVNLETTKWVTVEGGGISIDLLMRRMTDLEQTELSEIAAGQREHVIEHEKTVTGETHRERFLTAEPGRYIRARRYMLEKVVRGWRDVEAEGGKPLVFSVDSLDKLMGAYPEWARVLDGLMREFANLPAADDPAGKKPGAPDPQNGSASEPQP